MKTYILFAHENTKRLVVELPDTQDGTIGNNLAFVFNQIDKAIGARLRYLVLSPETTPNPEGFEFK